MTTVERLEELKTVDIKEIERDSLPKYKDLISELDSRKSNKMEVFHIFLLAGFLSYKNLLGTEISVPL